MLSLFPNLKTKNLDLTSSTSHLRPISLFLLITQFTKIIHTLAFLLCFYIKPTPSSFHFHCSTETAYINAFNDFDVGKCCDLFSVLILLDLSAVFDSYLLSDTHALCCFQSSTLLWILKYHGVAFHWNITASTITCFHCSDYNQYFLLNFFLLEIPRTIFVSLT